MLALANIGKYSYFSKPSPAVTSPIENVELENARSESRFNKTEELQFLLYFLSSYQNDDPPFHNHHDYHLCQEVTRAEYMGGLLVVIGHICLSYCQRLYAMIHVTDYIHTIC